MRLRGAAAVAAAAMPQPARPKAGPTKRQQHCSTTKEQLLWGGASLRSPLAFRGAAAVDAAAAAGLLEHRTNNSSTKEQLLWGGASLRSPLAMRGRRAAAAARTAEQPNSRTAEQPEQPNSRTARTAAAASPVRFRFPPLPSASPSRSCLS